MGKSSSQWGAGGGWESRALSRLLRWRCLLILRLFFFRPLLPSLQPPGRWPDHQMHLGFHHLAAEDEGIGRVRTPAFLDRLTRPVIQGATRTDRGAQGL